MIIKDIVFAVVCLFGLCVVVAGAVTIINIMRGR